MNEKIIKNIIEETGLNRMEIFTLIKNKKAIFPGITEFGALFILCKEMCVEFPNY